MQHWIGGPRDNSLKIAQETILKMKAAWRDAIHCGSVETLLALLNEGTDINARDRYGQTGLMLAAMEGKTTVVRFFIERGALLNPTAKYGLSALMLAVLRGHVGVVRLLVDAGASRDIRGTGAPGFLGKTAMDLAIVQGSSEIIEILGWKSE